LEEQLYDVAGEFFAVMELPGIVAEGFLNGEDIVVVDVEGEVASFAIEGWIACDSEAFGVVEDDDGILVGDAGVEPGKAAAGEFDLGGGDGLEGGVGRGDVALELALDLVNVVFKADEEVGEEQLALGGGDLCLML
jgi:hypothetical protein